MHVLLWSVNVGIPPGGGGGGVVIPPCGSGGGVVIPPCGGGVVIPPLVRVSYVLMHQTSYNRFKLLMINIINIIPNTILK